MRVLREKLPAAEVEYAVEDALVDAGYKGDYSTSVQRVLDSLLYSCLWLCLLVNTMYCKCYAVEQCDPPYKALLSRSIARITPLFLMLACAVLCR